tara:strand:- start:191 stop:1945 length:1755 start_codon:yes stop_codon:yes gene_type:complete
MKRLMVLMSVVLIFSMISFVSAVCTESDSGIDYTNQGDLYKGGEIIFDETAQGDNNVDSNDEVVVLSSTTAKLRSLSGVWIDVELNGEYDFDFGRGKITEVNFISADNRQNSIKVAYTRLEDFCFENTLIERTCSESGDHSTSYECPIACSNGACVDEIEEDECTDTDGGKDYNVRGVAANNQDSAGESCIGVTNWDIGYTVLESYCDSNGNVQQEEYECPVMCRNGACISEERDFSCEDSDGTSPYDQNYNNRGTVKVYFGDELLGSETDSCIGNNVLEKFCSDTSYGIVGVEKECARGCKNGACIIVCDDTDNGVDYFNKGEIYQDGEIIFEETSQGDNNVDSNDEVIVLSSTRAKLRSQDGNWIDVELNQEYDFEFGTGKITKINFISTNNRQNSLQVSYTRLEDYCFDNTLIERDCNQQGDKSTSYECEFGCINGECLKEATCVDSDGGKDYLVGGKTIGFENGNLITSSDGCRNDNKTLAEVYCEGNELKVEQKICSNGCEINACNPCLGCELNNECHSINSRKEGNYCSVEQDWIEQKSKEDLCENNYECKSNLCLENECVSGNIIAKFLRWLKSLFS